MSRVNRIALLSLLLFGLLTQTIFASTDSVKITEKENTLEDVELFAHFPYHEKLHIRESNWTQMEIEVKNQRGEQVQGKLQLVRLEGFSQVETLVAEQEVVVEPQRTAYFTYNLPVTIFGEWAYIRLLTLEGQEAFYELKDLYNNKGMTQITVVSEDENDFHFLKSMDHEYFHYPTSQTRLPSTLPEEFWLYHENMLAVGKLEKEGFTSEQITALEKWVKTGGVLLLSGGESFLKHADQWTTLLPVSQPRLESQSKKLRSTEEQQRLLDFLGIEAPPMEIPPLLVGEVKGQVSIYPHEELPLFYSWSFGKGLVILVAYDVSAEPLASWQGNKQLWKSFLNQSAAFYTMQKKDYHGSESYYLTRLSEQIPDLVAPSIGLITIIWIIYIFMIGPLLYLFLKKQDKREWAWVIIPTLVVLTAVSVYWLGVNRIASKSSSHSVSSIQIFDPEGAQIDTQASFFVLEGNDFQVEVQEMFEASAMSRRNQSKSTQSYLFKSAQERYLSYKSVPYMSLAQARGFGYSEELGYLEHDLWIEGNRLVGTLMNCTSLDLEQVELQIGKQAYPLGDLAKNEIKAVELKLAKYYYPEYQPQDSSLESKPFYGTRLNLYNQQIPSYYIPPHPVVDLYALSHSPLSGLHIDGVGVEEHYTHMVHQELHLADSVDKGVIFPYGILPVYLGNAQDFRGDYYYHDNVLTSGSAVPLEFQVQPLGLAVDRIEIPLGEAAFASLTIKIWNVKAEIWEELARDVSLELGSGEIAEYVNQQGVLRLLFENETKQNLQLPYPHVQVEGEWQS